MTFDEALDDLTKLIGILSVTIDEMVSQMALMDVRISMIDEDVRRLNSQM